MLRVMWSIAGCGSARMWPAMVVAAAATTVAEVSFSSVRRCMPAAADADPAGLAYDEGE